METKVLAGAVFAMVLGGCADGDPMANGELALDMDGQTERIAWDDGGGFGGGGGTTSATVFLDGLTWRASHSEYQAVIQDCPGGTLCSVTVEVVNTSTVTTSTLQASFDHDYAANGGNFGVLVDGCSNTTLAPGASCNLRVDYVMPNASARNYPGEIGLQIGTGTIEPDQLDMNNGSYASIRVCAEDDDPMNFCN